jgi:hypothetical protein
VNASEGVARPVRRGARGGRRVRVSGGRRGHDAAIDRQSLRADQVGRERELVGGPRPDAGHPLRYPFSSYDGKVTFERERSGTRTFDLNRDGVAHYGLMADLLADMRSAPGGSRALSLLFRSAEAYLEMWQRAVAHR